MNVRLNLLCRGHKPISRISRRLIVTESTKPSTQRTPSQKPSFTPDSSYSAKSSGKSDHRDTKSKFAKVHWALGEGYELGGVLKQGKTALDRHDERGLPTWGEWGVPIQLETESGSFVSAAWVLYIFLERMLLTVHVHRPNFWLRYRSRRPWNYEWCTWLIDIGTTVVVRSVSIRIQCRELLTLSL